MVDELKELKKRLLEIYHLSSIMALLEWDQEVTMPAEAGDARTSSIGYLSTILHTKALELNHDGLLTKLKGQLDAKKLRGKEAIIVREAWRDYSRQKKLPAEFVREMAEITSKAQQIWAKARAANDFKLFLPYLRKIVELKHQEAQCIGFTSSPYDALLDTYEPGMTTKEASAILGDLKEFLIPFLKEITHSQKKKKGVKALIIPKGSLPLDKQVHFNEYIARTIGFDIRTGRIDTSTHPFTTNMHPSDVRFTTRYKNDDIFHSIGSTIHEAGHGMYEQGLRAEYFGTALGESVSLGIHESQSRMWENNIGRSKEFWKYFYPKLQKEFEDVFKKISLEDFHTSINKVAPSLIRTEADEVTYNLHIIIRFEIEKELIEGTCSVKNLPSIWNAKMKEYLGVQVPDDSHGMLQDVHWSCGLFGYFPTYSFGNLYAAQFYSQMQKDIPDLPKKISHGEFSEIVAWLRKNIHRHGKTYTAQELVKKVTGKKLDSTFFKEYIKNRHKTVF